MSRQKAFQSIITLVLFFSNLVLLFFNLVLSLNLTLFFFNLVLFLKLVLKSGLARHRQQTDC